jgi:cephalosporin hydroxylase
MSDEMAATEAQLVERFHELYYSSHLSGGTWYATSWLGVKTWKCPLDLWIYQEMLHEIRPDLIVETGTAFGGSALYLASLCGLLGRGHVVTVDVREEPGRPRHERITYLNGSSTSGPIVDQVRAMAYLKRVLVILDSDHSKDHVLAELHAYAPLVTKGSYLVVEDTNLNGHPILPAFGPGPMEAVEEFLAESPEFEVDRTREKFLMTFNPGGFLKRVR